MRVHVDEKTKAYVRLAQQSNVAIISEADLAPLPEPMQRYLRYAKVLNKPKVKCAKVRQKGFMRTNPAQKGMPIEAVQYTTLVGKLTRTWYARVRIGPVNLLTGYDRYENGVGRMLMRLLSLYSVVDVSGPEVDISALIIFINDMVMWPTAFLSEGIHWEPVDRLTACAQVRLHDKQFSAELRFNEQGEMVDFITEDRYQAVGKTFQRTRWSTPIRNYGTTNGFRIPSEGEAVWHLPDGQFPYIQLKIGDILYDRFDFD